AGGGPDAGTGKTAAPAAEKQVSADVDAAAVSHPPGWLYGGGYRAEIPAGKVGGQVGRLTPVPAARCETPAVTDGICARRLWNRPRQFHRRPDRFHRRPGKFPDAS